MEQSERLSWDEFFVLLAVIYSSRGTCDRLRAACILVKNKRIVGAGYNGSVSGLAHCDEAGHLLIDNHCVRTIHAERNAVDNAISDLEGATAYITATPCIDCVKVLLQRGIKHIVYIGSYDNAKGKEYLDEMCRKKKVALQRWSLNPAEAVKCLRRAFFRLRSAGGLFQNACPEEFDFRY